MSNQNKIVNAFDELWQIIISERICFEFKTPEEYPQEMYGDFNASTYKIQIYKERTSPMTVWHIYAFAHELQHFRQYLQLKGRNSWYYTLDGSNIDDLKEDAKLEIEADEVAVAYLHKHKLRIPKTLKTFIEDRRSHFTDIIG